MSKNITSPTAMASSEISSPPHDILSDNGLDGHRNLHVDGEAAESFIAEKRIGERIKHLRLKKSMGLVELGRHTGLSASFLSQLETGRVVPTLRNLARIAMVFNWERKLAERPVWRPNSTRPIDFFNRRCLMRSPMRFSAMNDSAASPSTWRLRCPSNPLSDRMS